MRAIYVLIACASIQACSTVGSIDRPASYYHEETSSSQGGLVDEPVLKDNDAKINDLLNYQVKLPDENRIAALKLSEDSYWRFYSSDFNQLNESLVESFIAKLRSSGRVYDASFLPAMLVPDQRSVPVLREAAARFQADLLLAYRSSCQSYQKYRLISSNENKSYCSVEAILLDVRSGIIVKSVVSTEDFSTTKSDEDQNFSETIKKAELEAIAKALGSVANEVVRFLDNVPSM